MHEHELHEETVDTEPELTQMVSAWARSHAKVDMIMKHQGLAKLVRDGNEQAEMLEQTEQLGRYVEEEVEKLQVSHVNKRHKPDARMEEAEGGAQTEVTLAATET